MESKLSEGQKKMLEKIYNKIFDAATGKMYLQSTLDIPVPVCIEFFIKLIVAGTS